MAQQAFYQNAIPLLHQSGLDPQARQLFAAWLALQPPDQKPPRYEDFLRQAAAQNPAN